MVPPHSLAGKYTVSIAVFADGRLVQPGEEVKLSHDEAEKLIAANVATPVVVAPPPAVPPPPPVTREFHASRVTKMAPRIDTRPKTPAERALAGFYRVIHGSLEVPRPWDEWHNPDGTEKMGVPKTVRASITPSKFAIHDDPKRGIAKGDPLEYVGDEVWLNDEDAVMALDLGVVEPIGHTPSACGKVWQPPKPNAA